MSQKKQDQSSGSGKETGFAAAIALPMSLLGGWAAYGYSGSIGVAVIATAIGVAIGLVIFLIIARSGS